MFYLVVVLFLTFQVSPLMLYAGELDDSTIVACRKSGISFIYGHKKFHGISSVSTIEPDSIFLKNKYYYAIQGSNKIVNRFRRDMIVGVLTVQLHLTSYILGNYQSLQSGSSLLCSTLQCHRSCP